MWLLAAISCAVAGGLSTELILRNSEWNATQNLKSAEANLLSLGILELIANSTANELDPLVPQMVDSAQLNEIVRVFDARGKLIYANIQTRDLSLNTRQFVRHIDRGIFVTKGVNREYYSVARSFRSPQGKFYWLQIATPRPFVRQVVKENTIPFALMFITLLVVSLIVARWVAVQSLSPLTGIMKQIDALDSDRIKSWHPLSLSSIPKDFKPFVEKVNELIIRSQRSLLKFHQIGRFIAHEVRTPLTIIQGEIEMSLMQQSTKNPEKTKILLESALHEVSRIEQIVHTVLRLASKDRATDPYKPEIFNLSEFTLASKAEFERLSGRSIQFINNSPTSEVLMDKELLSLLLSNFARNVLRHTPPETKVTLRVEHLPGGRVELQIQDTGPGMSDELLIELNDPHAIGMRSGLGLNLCKEIVSVSKIEMEFSNIREGGLKIALRFPLVPAVST